jgi:hypothetical protein
MNQSIHRHICRPHVNHIGRCNMKTIMHNPLPQFPLVITIGSRKIHYTQSADTLEQAKQYAAQCFAVSPDRVAPHRP